MVGFTVWRLDSRWADHVDVVKIPKDWDPYDGPPCALDNLVSAVLTGDSKGLGVLLETSEVRADPADRPQDGHTGP